MPFCGPILFEPRCGSDGSEGAMAADQTQRNADGSEPLPAGTAFPHLGPGEREQAASHAPLRALVIHEVLREEGE